MEKWLFVLAAILFVIGGFCLGVGFGPALGL